MINRVILVGRLKPSDSPSCGNEEIQTSGTFSGG